MTIIDDSIHVDTVWMRWKALGECVSLEKRLHDVVSPRLRVLAVPRLLFDLFLVKYAKCSDANFVVNHI